MSPQISLNRLQAVKSLNPGAVQVILPDWFPVTLEEAVIFCKGWKKRQTEFLSSFTILLMQKKILSPHDWMYLKQHIPSLIGIKVFDGNRNPEWYKQIREKVQGLSVLFQAIIWQAAYSPELTERIPI